MRSLLAFLVLVLPLHAADIPAKIDAAAATLLKAQPKIAFAIGVRSDGKNHVVGYGTANTPLGKRKPDGDTLFEIGSITKSFTGILLAEGVRRGELTLDEPASKYLPANVPLPATVTLAHLATHRSGLPVEPPLIGVFAGNSANPYADYDRKKLKALLETITPEKPGTKDVYSNLGAGIAGIAVVHAAKAASFDALVKDRIAKPLGMLDTGEALTGEQRSRLAIGHDDDGQATSPWDFACLEACGGLRSTLNDMLKYAAANLGETDHAIKAAMQDSHKPRSKMTRENAEIGLFWLTLKRKNKEMLFHNGGTGGFHSTLVLLPKENIAVVILAAQASRDVDRTAFEILSAVAEGK